ncbi:MAG TPA: hypothetical protein VKV17_16225 [Bryobacteraceae bacterium]|nr:hypothetical protein [Bryobacteraceae bacterium]
MSSLARIEANRRNSLLSTGPVSDAGKSVSRMNAVKSGLYCKVLVLPTEDPAEYEALAAAYQQQYQPATPVEQYLVDRLIAGDWRLRRFLQAETNLWTANPDPEYALTENVALIRLYRIIATTERQYTIALKELERQIAARPQVGQALSPANPPAPAEPVAHAPAPELASFRPPADSVTPAPAPAIKSQLPAAAEASNSRPESKYEPKGNLALRL